MRFRLMNRPAAALWIFLSLFWIALTAGQLHRALLKHLDVEEHLVTLACWVLIFLLYVYMYFFSRLEFEPTALRLRSGLRSTWVPYDNIVAARPVYTGKGKRIPNQIELETARLSRDIYPHDYRRLAVSDPTAFVRALRDKAPQAEYDPA